jgi:biopolymer transport protein ExbD
MGGMIMARFGPRKSHENESLGHGDRPWVYFMIDCFFLVTQFFVLTFHVKGDDVVLPQKLPPGGSHPTKENLPPAQQTLTVHVSNTAGTVSYEFMHEKFSLQELTDALARVRNQNSQPIVKVSYEAAVPFGHVMAVFNTCAKLQVQKCGLIPLRSSES